MPTSSVSPAPPLLSPARRRGSPAAQRAATSERLQYVVLALIVLGGLLLRLRYLREPMRWDEAATFQEYARGSLGTIVSSYNRPNNQILYTLLEHLGIKTFGEGIAAVRLVAFAAGIAIVPASFLAARRLYDGTAGLFAAALTATFGPLVDYSVNGRGYTLGALFVVLSLWLGAVALDEGKRVAWAGFVLCSAAAIYTLPTMAIGVAAIALWMAANAALERRWRFLLTLAGALVAVGLLSLLLYSAVLGQRGWTAVTEAPREWHSIKALASAVWENWNRTAPHPFDWLVAAGFIAGVIRSARLVAAFLVVLVGVALFAPIAPFVRSWLFLLPIYLIVAAGGLSWASRRFGPVMAVATAVALAATFLNAGLKGSDVPPLSDNSIVPLLKRYVPKGHSVLIDRYVRAPTVYYYFERYGDPVKETGLLRSADLRPGHIVVVTAKGTSPSETVYKAGGFASGDPRLLLKREWISFYDVPILRQAQAHRLHYKGPNDRPQ
ncbi:MAG: glycosyltransferase family 39 protein [Labedaea sp.]